MRQARKLADERGVRVKTARDPYWGALEGVPFQGARGCIGISYTTPERSMGRYSYLKGLQSIFGRV